MRDLYVGTDFHLWSNRPDVRHPYRSQSSIGKLSANYGACIQEDDMFVFLGDLCDSEVTNKTELASIISSIRGYKVMCKGNHDTMDDDFYKEIGFDAVCDICKIHNLVFSHKPVRVASDELNIHGHLHTRKLSGAGYQHINAYGINHDKIDQPILVDDLIDSAAIQDSDSMKKEYWEKDGNLYQSMEDNDVYSNIIDLTDMVTISYLDEFSDTAIDPTMYESINQLNEILFQDVESTEYWLQDDDYKPGSRKKEPMADGEGTLDESILDIREPYRIVHPEARDTVQLYHGSYAKFKTLDPVAIDLGNVLQDIGWSVFLWDDKELAKKWAVFVTLRNIRRANIDLKQRHIRFIKTDVDTANMYTTQENFEVWCEYVKKHPVVGYVYTATVPVADIGLGNDTTHNEFTVRYSLKPDKIESIRITPALLEKMIIVQSEERINTLRDSDRANMRGRISVLFNRDFYYTKKTNKTNLDKLYDAVDTGDLRPGDDIKEFMKRNNIKIDKVPITKRLHSFRGVDINIDAGDIGKASNNTQKNQLNKIKNIAAKGHAEIEKYKSGGEAVLTEAATFRDVNRIVDNIPKEEHNRFYHGPQFKDSPFVKYRDVVYVPHNRGKAGAFIEIYAFNDDPATGIVVIAAEPEARGKGLTDKLLQKAISAAPSLSLTKLSAQVDKDNPHSYNMAIRNGFVDVSNGERNSDQYKLILNLVPVNKTICKNYCDHFYSRLKSLAKKYNGDGKTFARIAKVTGVEEKNLLKFDPKIEYSNERQICFSMVSVNMKLEIRLEYQRYINEMCKELRKDAKDFPAVKHIWTSDGDALVYIDMEFESGQLNEAAQKNYKDLSDIGPVDREEKKKIAEKYGLKAVGQEDSQENEEKPDSPEKRVKELRKQREKNLKKANRARARKRIVRTIKSHLPGVKNESMYIYTEGTAVDTSEVDHYDTDNIEDNPLYGRRKQIFPQTDMPQEESVTLSEGALTNIIRDLTFVAKGGSENVAYTGNYEKLRSRLIEMVDSTKSIDRLIYLRKDAYVGIKQLDALANNMEAVQKGTQSKYVSVKDIQKRFDSGNSPQKIRAHQTWIRISYIPHINGRIKELKNKLNEAASGYEFYIEDRSFRFLDRMNETPEDDGKLYPVYIMLMHSGTALSTAIKAVTRSNFSHSSISFDSSMHSLYSFGRKADVNPFIGGFKKEDIRNKFFKERDIPYALYMVPCTKTEIELMKKRLDYFIKNTTKFHYDFAGLFKNYFGISDNPEYKWFCSRFVADILNSGRPSSEPYVMEPSLMKPEDFRNTNFAQYVSGGFLAAYDQKFVDKITTRLLRLEKARRKHQDQMDKSMSIQETVYDIDYQNPYLENVFNYQLMTMDESVVDQFLTYLKSFKLRFDKEGNIIITRREYDQLDSHFKASLKMIKTCEKAGNLEGVKTELAKIYYMIHLINDQYLSNKTARKSDLVKKDMLDLRSVMLNVFQQHLKYITSLEPKFNFQSYYDGSKYGKDTEIPKATMTAIGKTVVTLLS